jgi:hypothetical protein
VQAVAALLVDTQHGWARSMLPLALSRTKRKREFAVAVLLTALSDDDLVAQAAVALTKLKAKEATIRLRELSGPPNKDIQRAIEKALQKLSR